MLNITSISDADPDPGLKPKATIVADLVAQQLAIKEHFVAQYLAATGAKIEDTVLCEQFAADGKTRRYWCEPRDKRAKTENRAFLFLLRKYVQSADDRQRAMGLQYTTAETHDLAKEITNFIYSI